MDIRLVASPIGCKRQSRVMIIRTAQSRGVRGAALKVIHAGPQGRAQLLCEVSRASGVDALTPGVLPGRRRAAGGSA